MCPRLMEIYDKSASMVMFNTGEDVVSTRVF